MPRVCPATGRRPMSAAGTTGDFFAQMPPVAREKLKVIAGRYLPLIPGSDAADPFPDAAAVIALLQWQHMEAEIVGAHAAWLQKVKSSIEQSGREYNRDSFLRYCRENE